MVVEMILLKVRFNLDESSQLGIFHVSEQSIKTAAIGGKYS